MREREREREKERERERERERESARARIERGYEMLAAAKNLSHLGKLCCDKSLVLSPALSPPHPSRILSKLIQTKLCECERGES